MMLLLMTFGTAAARDCRRFPRAEASRGWFSAPFGRETSMSAPVNPAMSEVEGATCYSHVQDIQPPVDTALLMTPPAVTDEVVQDCADAGIRRIWLYRRSTAAAAFCEAHGMSVIAENAR